MTELSDWIRWALVAALGGLALLVTVSHWMLIFGRGSMVPLIGGLFGACSLSLAGLGTYWWIPWVVDPGSGLMVIGLTHAVATGQFSDDADGQKP